MEKSFDEPRSSVGASSSTSNSDRQASSSSYTLPPLPPSTDSLTTGTSIPAPAPAPLPPVPPPKDPSTMAGPMTPQRKPVLRQKSPLSNEAYFASPASSMPGAFPTSPPEITSPTSSSIPDTSFTTHVYASSQPSSPNSKGPKRPSSIRNLLSFKAMRKSYDNTSPEAPSRPESSAGRSSVSSSPSLNKKKSGSFWKRKSSLAMSFPAGDDTDERPSTPRATGDIGDEQARSPTPRPASAYPTVEKRKSGTFWRRRSSMGLAAAFGANGSTGGVQNGNGATNGTMNGGHAGTNGHKEDITVDEQENEKPLPLSPTSDLEKQRSWTPPPQLPAFIGGGGSLGGEDLFKDIN